MTTVRDTQAAIVSISDPSTANSRVTQLATVSVQSPPVSPARLFQMALITVAANNIDYVQLNNPFSLPCFNPCTSYGTFATIIRIGN